MLIGKEQLWGEFVLFVIRRQYNLNDKPAKKIQKMYCNIGIAISLPLSSNC